MCGDAPSLRVFVALLEHCRVIQVGGDRVRAALRGRQASVLKVLGNGRERQPRPVGVASRKSVAMLRRADGLFVCTRVYLSERDAMDADRHHASV